MKAWICFWIIWMGCATLAQGQAGDPYAQGMAAFKGGDLVAAAEAFDAVGRSEATYAQARYMLARVYLAPPLLDVNKAQRALQQALRHEPDNTEFLTLRLYLRHHHGSALLPAFQTAKTTLMAEELLAAVPDHALAHRVLGITAYQDYDEAVGAVGFTQLSGGRAGGLEDGALNSIPFALEAQLIATDSGQTVQFYDRYQGRTFDALHREGRAQALYRKAVGHLQQAIAAEHDAWEAYPFFMRAAIREQDHALVLTVLIPHQARWDDRPDLDLFLGWAYERAGNLAEATRHFDRALSRMPEADKVAFGSVEPFLNEAEKAAYEADAAAYTARYWDARDPRQLTPVNERLLAHYARMVYADLRFGRGGLRGWQTEPGQVVVRYGIPIAEARHSSLTETYLLFHYGHLQFRFMDLAKAGRYTFYSPPANAFRGPRNVHAEWAADYAIKGPETFRNLPEQFDLDGRGRRVAFPYLMSSFRGRGGQTTVYIPYGIPRALAQALVPGEVGITAAAFATDQEGGKKEVTTLIESFPARQTFRFEEANIWAGWHQLDLSPGPHRISVEFEDRGPSGRMGFHQSDLSVPEYDGAMAMSDVLLAYHVEEEANTTDHGGMLQRRGYAIQPAPWGVFGVGQPLYLYFEVYNLTRTPDGQTQYSVEAVLIEDPKERGLEKLLPRAFRRRQAGGVSARFEGQGRSPDEGQYLILDTQGQPPGTYVLAVRVTDRQTGETVERGRTLILE